MQPGKSVVTPTKSYKLKGRGGSCSSTIVPLIRTSSRCFFRILEKVHFRGSRISRGPNFSKGVLFDCHTDSLKTWKRKLNMQNSMPGKAVYPKHSTYTLFSPLKNDPSLLPLWPFGIKHNELKSVWRRDGCAHTFYMQRKYRLNLL